MPPKLTIYYSWVDCSWLVRFQNNNHSVTGEVAFSSVGKYEQLNHILDRYTNTAAGMGSMGCWFHYELTKDQS